MKLIKNLPTRMINGRIESYGIFWCVGCKQEVEKPLSAGKKCKSCGCNKIKHGEIHTKLYRVWSNMKNRCSNSKHPAYKNYGGRGITICNEWLEFIPFRDWALSNGYQESLEIDRIDNNGNYEPSNCRFITAKENCQNQRTTKLSLKIAIEIITLYRTREYTQQDLSIKYGVSQKQISRIIRKERWV